MNNFDSSKNGVTLEMSIQYDNDLSQMWFNDSFKRVESVKDTFLFTDYGNIVEDFDINDIGNYYLKSVTKKILLCKVKEIFGDCMKEDSLHYFNKYPYQLNKLELVELVENLYDQKDYFDFLTDTFKPKFIKIESKGYSQGDINTVIVLSEYFDNEEPTKEQLINLRTEIDHLMWDCPIYQWLMIDGEQFYIDEFTNYRYIYDKDETLKICKERIEHEKKAYILEWLEENLPSEPEYR